MTEALDALKSRLQEVVSLAEVGELLDWDIQTMMPSAASDDRARQVSVIERLEHDLLIGEETGRLLDTAARESEGAAYDSDDASIIRVALRDYTRARKVPSDLVAEVSHAAVMGHRVWATARAKNDFKSFIPTLEHIISLKKRVADAKGYTDHPYDALLDDYEPGLKAAEVDFMFAELRKDIVPLVRAITEHTNKADVALVRQDYPIDKQRAFAERVIKDFGYDFDRGRQDLALHPFCSGMSSNDVRITTRFDPKDLSGALFSTLHEAGHGMYEQGVNNAFNGTPMSGGTSLGVHESQSRMWENLIGRSRGFWKHYFPILQSYFPDQLGKADLNAFYRAINYVEPSFIRTESDETTYNLHVMIRFELEKGLLDGSVKVADLPDAWNAKSKEYLGIVPPTDTLGVLQDVHWSAGLFGYFPTYSIGNLLSVQLYDKALEAHPSIPTEIEHGKFGTLLSWLRENVHQYGRKYEPNELIKRATGSPLQSTAYVHYLKTKFGELYSLN